MKPTCRYIAAVLLSASTFMVKAKEGSAPYNSPVQFIQNKGQITDQHGVVRKDIDVKIEANGVVLFVGDGELHYQWVAAQSQTPIAIGAKVKTQNGVEENNSLNGVFPFRGDRGADSRRTNSEVDIYRMDVKLVGANKNAQVIFEEPTGYHENYYLAHTGENGVRANGYSRVIYKDIYPNIDLVLYTLPAPLKGSDIANGEPMSNIHHPTSNIKYDFIVYPGGNPADIQLRYEGATEVKLVDGSLVAITPFGTITEKAPYSYEAESKKEIGSGYILDGNELRFDIGKYAGTLVIDPTVDWGTYYGNQTTDEYDVVTDNDSGYVYMVGKAFIATNIATTGAHQVTHVDSGDGYLVKFAPDGGRIWGTFYGGANPDVITSITIAYDGTVIVGGATSSASGIASTGSHQNSIGGGTDGFLAKFTPAGQRLWGSYYGGSSDDGIKDVACDAAGNIFICGATRSMSGIVAGSTHQTTHGGGYDAFIAKFNTNCVRQWGTYYGGSADDGLESIVCNRQGNIYVCGITKSSNSIASTGSHQPAKAAGSNDEGFFAKFNTAGQRQWGSYYGGNGITWLFGIAADISSNIVIGGFSTSTSGISTTGVHQVNNAGNGDGLLARFNTNGQRLWGSYYGGSAADQIHSVAIGEQDNIYLSGVSYSTTGISTTNGYQTSHTGFGDAFIAIFSLVGNRLYSTYYGGSSYEDYHNDIAVNYRGNAYLAGITESQSGIATTGAFQTTWGGGPTAFLVQFNYDTLAFIRRPYTDTVHCPGDTVRLVYEVSTAFNNGNSFTVQLSDATGSFASPVNIGTRADTAGDTITCVIPVNTPPGSSYRLRIAGSHPATTSWDNNSDIRIKPTLQNIANSSNSPVCTGDTLHLTGSSTGTGITWAWTGPNSFSSSAEDTFIANAQLIDSGKYILKTTLNSTGCSLSDTTTVEMRLTPIKPVASSNSPVCETLPLTLTTGSSTSGVSYTWAGPGSYSNSTQNPTVATNASSNHAGDYISTATLNGCSSRDTTTVVVLPKPPTPTAGATNSPLCARQDLQLTASTVTGASYAWYGPLAFTANTQNPVRANIQMGDAGAYYVYATVSGCVSDTDSVVVTVNTDPFVNIFPTPGASVCQGKQVIFTAVPTNGGTISYNWLVNGISTGSTGLTYSTTTLSNGDAVSCAMTSTGTCATPFIDTSNAITMTVQPILTPTVTMTADNMPPWNGGLTVTFTATPTHGGANPEYQWKRNGADVVGATGANWGVIVNALNDNEDICVVLKSSYECAVPDTAMSNCITTAFTGVGDVAFNSGFKIYPNPTSTILHVEGVESGAMIELIDLLGRSARRQLLTAQGTVDVSGLVPGVYVVRVNGVVAGRVVKE